MLIAADLLILTIDRAGGLVGNGDHASSRDVLARALLIDLIVLGALALDQGRLRVIDPLPLSHRLHSLAVHLLGDGSHTPTEAVTRLRRRMWSVRSDLLDAFVRLGVIHRLSGGLFGRFGRPRYALQSTQTHAERLAKLRRGFESPSLDDLSAVGLALLADSVRLAEHFVASESRLRLRRWAQALAPSPAIVSGGGGAPRQRLSAILAVLPST